MTKELTSYQFHRYRQEQNLSGEEKLRLFVQWSRMVELQFQDNKGSPPWRQISLNKSPIEIWDLSKRSALHCCLPFLIHSAAQLKTSGRSRGGSLSLFCIFKTYLLWDSVLFYFI